MNELLWTSWFLVAFGALLALSALFSRTSARVGLPVFLVFLGVGMLAGSEGIGGIEFEDFNLAFRLGIAALAVILFDGGLNTPMEAFRRGLAPGTVLATVGVLGTAGLVAAGIRLWGMPWPVALLLGAVVSSTDAAAVFSVLRGSGLRLRRRVSTALEVESCLNDPMAVLLTLALTEGLLGEWTSPLELAGQVLLQLGLGAATGIATGFLGRGLLRTFWLPAGGLYPVLTLGVGLLAFGLPTLLGGSGFLSVYLAGLLVGNGHLPQRSAILRFHDAAAWCGQVTMFLMLGLLVFPSRLVEVAPVGLFVGLLLALVARPLVTFVCLAPFRFPWRESLFVGWVGLRGAVPIILSMFPVLAGLEGADRLFDLVFFVVVVSAIVPGATVPWVTGRLKLASEGGPPPGAVLEMSTRRPLAGDVLSFYIDEALSVCGARLTDLPFPQGAAVMLVVRGEELIAPRGSVQLLPGDHVHLFCRPEDRAVIELLFGRPEE
jgi:potassium/hydrogen antiporter